LEKASAAANGPSPPCKEIRRESFSLIPVCGTCLFSWLIIVHAFFLCRNPELLVEYLQDEQLGSMSDTHRLTGGVGIHKLLFSPPELMRESIHEVPHGHEYIHPTSIPDSNFKKTQELGFPLGVRIHSKAKNLSSLHMVIPPIFCCSV
jgi:hypothetical protein